MLCLARLGQQTRQYFRKSEQKHINCTYCARHMEGTGNCPAFGQTSQACGKYNHLTNVFRVVKLYKIVTADSEEALMTLTGA